MSSTNRSNCRDTHVSDYYKTPVSEILLFLDNVNSDIIKGDVLDPCAGGIRERESMSYVEALEQHELEVNSITSIDIREDSCAQIIGDYLQIDCKNKYDTIITNPPFSIAQKIIEKALDDIKESGHVIMLLRLNYFESKLRKKFFENYMPKYCFVYHNRLSFTPDGKTDSIAHAHFIWQEGFHPEFTMLKVI
jgi:hypothetical protein